jgi:hypothetical protein
MLLETTKENNTITSIYESSNIFKSRYFSSNNELHITFNNGNVYKYNNVDIPTFLKLQEAQSIGKFFASEIKPKFQFEKIGSEDPKIIIEDIKKLKSKMGFSD